ncbi:hypothetical protein Psta_0283 [Pirellula staleyi DSM 6068]|uniref:Uncharacterized protein n=1 Tax=Pirellula staleyi (strain ATCC 27377 / DSM 6068 / ICPB 4128) TaxID=530564 RepID=D2R1J1_PIRSD|nr:hypothetical protein Psta_0283 [Pirellula staleyi DSM 6068]
MNANDIGVWLRDPFGKFVISQGRFPLTLRKLLEQFDKAESRLDEQQNFVVADGGQILWNAETEFVERSMRFAITRFNAQGDSVLISTAVPFDSESQFLQLLAWDASNEVFNYYERRNGTWIWAGNSYHALREPTRGKGPFDSHVNGSLVMKELKFPWMHWHSMASIISDDVLAPSDLLRTDPIWRSKLGADDFEIAVVRPGIRKWTEARTKKFVRDHSSENASNAREILRHLFETTTVNLIASGEQSRSITDQSSVKLPITFFLNSDVLFDLLELEPEIVVPSVAGEFYRESLRTFEFKLQTNNFEQPGDTHFAFIVPEAAFEDNLVVAELLKQSVVSARFVACVLMVDFANPISSSSRELLLKYIPDRMAIRDGVLDLEAQFIANVEAAISETDESDPASPEQQFLSHWNLGDAWKQAFESRVEAYFQAIQQRLGTQHGYDDYIRLAESRRREFRRRPLSEFDLTLPVTNIPADAPLLQMFEDGRVGIKQGT